MIQRSTKSLLVVSAAVCALVFVGLAGCGPDDPDIGEGDEFDAGGGNGDNGDNGGGGDDAGDNGGDEPDAGTQQDADAGGAQGPPCWEEEGPFDDPNCEEPSSCPSPDNSKDPEVTCSSPVIGPELSDITVHFYGKYLVAEDNPPPAVIHREVDNIGDEPTGAGGSRTDDVTVVSDCHVKAELNLSTTHAQCGDIRAFRLQRQTQDQTDRDVDFKGIVSEWRYLRLTESEN